jgi:hypothetical protein
MGGPGAVAWDVALAASFDVAAAQVERLLRPVWRWVWRRKERAGKKKDI